MQKYPFHLFIFSLCLLLLLTACGSSTLSDSGSATNSTEPSLAIGSFKEFNLPKTGSGMMRPAIDSKGRVWFGEMSHNFLTMFDSQTQTFTEITPPHGAYSVMGVVVAPDDTVWFAEQDANYIGHYFPDTKRFQTYSLPMLHILDPSNTKHMLALPSAPNDLAFDRHGNLWFTELNADSIAMLTTHTGAIRQYPLSSAGSIQKLNPYGITVDAHDTVWFTESTAHAIGGLDAKTGKIRLFTLSDASAAPMEIASDAQGNVWATSFNNNQLIQLNTTKGAFTSFDAPTTTQGSGGLYGLTITQNGEVWVTVPAENALALFDTKTQHFAYSAIPSPNSFPFGLAMDGHNRLWFTEAGSDKIGMLQR